MSGGDCLMSDDEAFRKLMCLQGVFCCRVEKSFIN